MNEKIELKLICAIVFFYDLINSPMIFRDILLNQADLHCL